MRNYIYRNRSPKILESGCVPSSSEADGIGVAGIQSIIEGFLKTDCPALPHSSVQFFSQGHACDTKCVSRDLHTRLEKVMCEKHCDVRLESLSSYLLCWKVLLGSLYPDTPWDCQYMPTLTPLAPPQLIGSPMPVPWSVWV